MSTVKLPQRLTGAQKLFAIMLLGAATLGGIWLFNNYLAPLFINFFENMWKVIFLGGPLVFAAIYVISNPFVIWTVFKGLSWKLTSWIVKQDPLSVMDRYVEWLHKKLSVLRKSIEVLRGKQVKLDRRISDLANDREKYLNLGVAAKQQENERAASLNGTKANSLKTSISILQPLKDRVDKTLTYMGTIEKNWSYSLEQTAFEIENKRAEYEIIRETVKGLRSADDMINSDSPEARLYGLSLKHLEEQVTQNMGEIEEFERRSRDIIANINIEQKANENAGLKELEDYIQKSNILLPGTFETAKVQVTKFNLLNKNK